MRVLRVPPVYRPSPSQAEGDFSADSLFTDAHVERHVREISPVMEPLQREIPNTLHHLATSLIYSSPGRHVCMFVRGHVIFAQPTISDSLTQPRRDRRREKKNVALSFMILSSWCPRTGIDNTAVRMLAEAWESHILRVIESTPKIDPRYKTGLRAIAGAVR